MSIEMIARTDLVVVYVSADEDGTSESETYPVIGWKTREGEDGEVSELSPVIINEGCPVAMCDMDEVPFGRIDTVKAVRDGKPVFSRMFKLSTLESASENAGYWTRQVARSLKLDIDKWNRNELDVIAAQEDARERWRADIAAQICSSPRLTKEDGESYEGPTDDLPEGCE